MELVFFYINQTKSKFIEKTGFNFSPRYKFEVEYDGQIYTLKGIERKKALQGKFFDETGCVTNITAIVGENGSGKTTLLTELLSYSGAVKDENHTSDYEAYFEEQYEIDKAISIYLDGEDLLCFHNIDKFRIDTNLLETRNVCYLKQGSYEIGYMIANHKGPFDISKICVSNSAYVEDNGLIPTGVIEQISLNMNSIRILGNRFFRKKTKTSNRIKSGYYEIQDIMTNSRQMMEFQRILDILYIDYLHTNKSSSMFSEDIGKKINIRFHTVRKIFNDYYKKNTGDRYEEEHWKIYYDKVMKEIFAEFDYNTVASDICFNLYTNLLYEILALLEFPEIKSVKSKQELIEWIKELLTESRELLTYDVLKEAYEEIVAYENILKKAEIVKNTLPPSDWAYEACGQLEYKGKNTETVETEKDIYQQFMELIRKSVFDQPYSFVLKYIDIEGIELASGERALLNFFSWIYLMPRFNQIINGKEANSETKIHKNILLLIDEIDLYCHPLWQQKILNFLIEELKKQYSDKKVQIIFTTHSPIVLSDMPRSNVIFLKRENDKCIMDDTGLHEETFGANIYKLFNDAFFLGQKGQIGEFSKNKIQTIIDKIRPELEMEKGAVYPHISKEETEMLEKEIALIGEPVIRNKLYDMLYKCQCTSENSKQRKMEFYRRKIQKLEEESYDTD